MTSKRSNQTSAPTIQLDILLRDNWNDQETANVRVVVDFFQRLMNEHDFDYVSRTYGGASYTQHNRAIPDEISGLLGYVKTMTKRFPEYSFEVKKIFADGDFVILHSHVTMKAKHRGDETKGFIITDTFRLEEGRLAEHWDAIQPIDLFSRTLFLLSGGAVGNNNPTF